MPSAALTGSNEAISGLIQVSRAGTSDASVVAISLRESIGLIPFNIKPDLFTTSTIPKKQILRAPQANPVLLVTRGDTDLLPRRGLNHAPERPEDRAPTRRYAGFGPILVAPVIVHIERDPLHDT